MPQKVYFSLTQSGLPGLFTERIIAHYLTDPAELFKFVKDPIGYCRVYRFEIETDKDPKKELCDQVVEVLSKTSWPEQHPATWEDLCNRKDYFDEAVCERCGDPVPGNNAEPHRCWHA